MSTLSSLTEKPEPALSEACTSVMTALLPPEVLASIPEPAQLRTFPLRIDNRFPVLEAHEIP
ncbi:MAG: hypothetical protein ACK58T_17075, partial [Phycisphaerae bacterium]